MPTQGQRRRMNVHVSSPSPSDRTGKGGSYASVRITRFLGHEARWQIGSKVRILLVSWVLRKITQGDYPVRSFALVKRSTAGY